MKSKLLGVILACGLVTPAFANQYEPSMRDYLESEILMWAFDPVLIDAIRAQNKAHEGLDQAQIDALDQKWRGEVGADSHPTIDSVLKTPASDFLRERASEAGGIISEAFVMDSHGLNVAASDVTSDYWQGDEAKFQQTYDVGPGAVHVGEVEFDESANSYLGQVSIAVTDPDSNEVIGAITVGLNAEMLY